MTIMNKILYVALSLSAVTIITIQHVHGHGVMLNPPSRSALWRFFKVPKDKVNYDDMELFCGNRTGLQEAGGKCGICGDPYLGERKYETGGSMFINKTTNRYRVGQNITVRVKFYADHGGRIYFDLCPKNSSSVKETESCFRPLKFSDGSTTKVFPDGQEHTGQFCRHFDLQLPDKVTCTNCILRWNWNSTWTRQMFRNCADVSIAVKGKIKDFGKKACTTID